MRPCATPSKKDKPTVCPWFACLAAVLDLLEVLEPPAHVEPSVLQVLYIPHPVPSDGGEYLAHPVRKLHQHGQATRQVVQQVVEREEAVRGDVDLFTLKHGNQKYVLCDHIMRNKSGCYMTYMLDALLEQC